MKLQQFTHDRSDEDSTPDLVETPVKFMGCGARGQPGVWQNFTISFEVNEDVKNYLQFDRATCEKIVTQLTGYLTVGPVDVIKL